MKGKNSDAGSNPLKTATWISKVTNEDGTALSSKVLCKARAKGMFGKELREQYRLVSITDKGKLIINETDKTGYVFELKESTKLSTEPKVGLNPEKDSRVKLKFQFGYVKLYLSWEQQVEWIRTVSNACLGLNDVSKKSAQPKVSPLPHKQEVKEIVVMAGGDQAMPTEPEPTKTKSVEASPEATTCPVRYGVSSVSLLETETAVETVQPKRRSLQNTEIADIEKEIFSSTRTHMRKENPVLATYAAKMEQNSRGSDRSVAEVVSGSVCVKELRKTLERKCTFVSQVPPSSGAVPKRELARKLQVLRLAQMHPIFIRGNSPNKKEPFDYDGIHLASASESRSTATSMDQSTQSPSVSTQQTHSPLSVTSRREFFNSLERSAINRMENNTLLRENA